jgi:hypothetical protein
MKKFLFHWCCILVILGFVLSAPAWGQTPMWGPEVFVRGTGQPVTDTMYFSVPDSTWQYTIVVQNGVSSGIRVSSATIRINGEVIVGPNEFNQNVSEITKPLRLRKDNQVTVRLTSKPGGTITVAIYGPSSTTAITPQGGTVNLDGFASVAFPAGAFSTNNVVTMWVTSSQQAQANYSIAGDVYDAGPRLPYEVRICSGSICPTSDFEVTIPIPDDFLSSLVPDFKVSAFAQVYQDGGLTVLDHFERVASIFDPMAKTLHMTLPWWTFTNQRNSNNLFEAVIICGSVHTL